jgi:hypothetical protein
LLRIKRTLDGAEIDKIIADVQARKALVIERLRRADWRRRELAANGLQAKCGHARAVTQPYPAPDQMR